MKPAVFIDRDGTLVEEVNYLSRIEDLDVFPFAADALGRLRSAGYEIFVVTNQSGIGRGIFTEAAMHAIHREISRQLPGLIDGYYFCPHLPDAGCECRKPRPGMLNAARAEHSIDIGNSWMIGDKQLDVELGLNAGMKSILVRTGYGASVEDKVSGDVLATDDLLQAALHITAQSRRRA
jgi:D-glycero-D-manno-heptose 1,7-bisphosphate phosphatase